MSRANRNLRGWLLHEERICFDNLAPNDHEDENSFYSQSAGRPGTPVALDEIGMARPHAHHAQERDLSIIAIRPGIPAADTGAGFGYRAEGDPEIDFRGWNEPNLVQGYRPVDWTTTALWQDVQSVTCPRSQKVVTLGRDTSATVDPTYWVWDPTTREWAAGVELDAGVFTGTMISIMVLRSTERILALAVDDTTNFGIVYFSDDDGSTWAEYSRPFFVTLSATKIRLIEDGIGNVIALAVDEVTGNYTQYVSTDSAVTFASVDSDTAFLTDPSFALTTNGRLVLTFRFFTTGGGFFATTVGWITLDDAFDPVSGKTPQIMTGFAMVSVETCADADGTIYTVMTKEASDIVHIERSIDSGDTFEDYSYDILATGGTIGAPASHRHLIRSLVPSGGELLGLFNSVHTVSTPTTDGSLISLMLGGWANIESLTTVARRQRFAWAYTAGGQDLDGVFLPTEILDLQGWAHTGDPEILLDGYHRFAPGASTSFDTLNFAGAATGPTAVLVEAHVEGAGHGDLASNELSMLYRRRDGSNEKALRIRWAGTGFLVIDDAGPTTLATVMVDMTATHYQFLALFATDRRVTVYYRTRASSLWIEVAQAILGLTVSATTTDQLMIGATSSTSGALQIGIIAFAGNTALGGFLNTGVDDDGLFTEKMNAGKTLGPVPYPVRDQVDIDGNMTFLSASGGVARHQERWQIPAEWDRGIREIHPVESPKPSAGWRSLDETEQIIVWDLGVDTRLGSSWGLGAAFIRCNFHQALVEASTDADPTTWVVLGAYIGFMSPLVSFTRSGNLIIPAPGTPPGSLFYAGGSLRGGQAILDPAGSPPYPRRILDNQSGGWQDSGAQAVLRIEGLTGAEPTSGSMYIAAPSGVLVMHSATPTAYRRYRLRIPEQATPDGHFRLGKFVLGSIFAMGRQWSRGWSWRYVPITRSEQDDEGTVFVDPRGSEFSRSYRRELTVSFQDGYDESKIRNGTAPHLSASAGTPALVADQDVQFQLMHLLRSSRGGSTPSVVLPEIPSVTANILDQEMFSFGRLGVDQPWQVNNVQGDEGRSTVYRGEGITHIELV